MRLSILIAAPAAVLLGALGGLAEGIRSGADSSLLLPAALLGAAVGVAIVPLTIPCLLIANRTKATLAFLGACAIGGAVLVALGLHKKDAGDAAAWLFGSLALTGTLTMTAALLRRTSGWKAAVLSLLASGAAIATLLADPMDLRTVYLGLDLLALGCAAGALLAVAAALPRRAITPLAITSILLVGLTLATPPDPLAASDLSLRSPRMALVDRLGNALGLLERPPLEQPEGLVVARPRLDAAAHEASRARWGATRADQPPLDVLWITIDTVRADATGIHGGEDTPVLDRLGAESGIVFRRAWSQGPGTLLSMESFMTGRFPSRSGLARIWATGEEKEGEIPTLAMRLHEAGYATTYLTNLSSNQLREKTFARLPRGFARLLPREGPGPDAARTVDRYVQHLQAMDERPDFTWLHLFDPHHPYEARGDTPPNASARERWSSEVRHVDAQVGRVFAALKAAGRATRTLVVVHSDHGEAFGEHGRYYHASSYRDVQIRIPLLLFVPGMEARVFEQPVGNVDLHPTLLAILGLPADEGADGHDLLPALLDAEVARRWPPFAYADSLVVEDDGRYPGERVRMITDGHFKLIQRLSDRSEALFDLEEDPGELHNVLRERRSERDRLAAWLAALAREAGGGGAGDEDLILALIEELRALASRERGARVARLVMEGREGELRGLEARLSELDPELAQLVLVATQAFLRPVQPPSGTLAPRAAEPPSLKWRRALAPVVDPRHAARSDEAGDEPDDPFTAYASMLASTDVRDVEALRALGAADARGWLELGLALATREPERWAPWLHQRLRGVPDEITMARLAERLATIDPDRLATWMLERWPRTDFDVQPRTLGHLARLVRSAPRAVRRRAAVALLPLLGSESGPRALDLEVEEATRLRDLGQALAEGRHGDDAAQRRRTLAFAREQARRLEISLPPGRPQGETEGKIAWKILVDPPLTSRGGLTRITLTPDRDVAIGTRLRPMLQLSWHHADPVEAAAALETMRAALPRRTLTAGTPLTLTITAPAIPAITGALTLRGTVGPDALPPVDRLEEAPGGLLEGAALARRLRAQPIPLVVMEGGGGIEGFSTANTLVDLPAIRFGAGERSLRVDIRSIASEAGTPKEIEALFPEATVTSDATGLTIRWRQTGSAARRIRLRLPSRAGLWQLSRITWN